MGDPEACLAQKLLPDLQQIAPLCQDVSIFCQNSKLVLRTSSMILASISPMLFSALKDVENDENILIIIPDGESTVEDLNIFFESIYKWNFENDDVGIQESIIKLVDLFSIPFGQYVSDQQDSGNFEQVAIKHQIATVGGSNLGYSNVKNFKCKQCDLWFSSSKLEKRHSRTVHSENHPHVCGLCGRRCRGPAELLIHQRCHSKEKPYSCECGKYFAQKSQLNDHRQRVHMTKEIGEIVCQICCQVLTSPSAMKRHRKIHLRPEQTEASENVEKSVSEEDEGTELAEISDKNIEFELKSKENIDCSNEPKSTKIYECLAPNCGKVYKSVSSMKLHTSSHTGGKEFSCALCKKKFSQQSHLNVHIKILHEGVKPFMCSFCGRQFAVKSNLIKHIRMHERKRIEEMEEEVGGDATIQMENNIEIDLESVVAIEIEPLNSTRNPAERSIFVCEFCGQAFNTEDQMKSHARTHDKRAFVCDLCNINFDTWSARKIHQKDHTGGEQHICETCNLACLSRSSLSKHQLTHTGLRPHECNVDKCGKKFVQKSHLNYHIKVVHGPPVGSRPKPHACIDCGACFTTSSTLRKHQRIHNGDRPHQCNECGKKFVQKTHLLTHQLRHSGERPFVCEECGKGFVTTSNLSEHAKLHSGTKTNFKCSEQGCDSKYAGAFDLKVHSRKHSGEAPFGCQVCRGAFRSKRLLDEHFRIHSGTVPFVCSNCSKTFTTASGLKQHFKRHDTCRLAATPGSFSIHAASNMKLSEESKPNLNLQDDDSTLLADSILAT